MQKQRELMQEELKRSTQKTLSAEERAQQMDQMLSDEEARIAQLEKEMAALREKQVRIDIEYASLDSVSCLSLLQASMIAPVIHATTGYSKIK